MMGEEVNDDIDGDVYVSVELALNQTIVNIKRKRLLLKSERDQLLQANTNPDRNKDKKRSRSRSVS